MKINKLTIKQEKFVQGLIKGLSQREAYKRAYNCKKWKDSTIDVKASELLKNGKVLVRFEALQKKHEEKALWTKAKATHELIWMMDTAKTDIKAKGVRQANSSAFLNAIKELNEVEGIKTDKIQVEHSGTVSNPFAELSVEELRALAGSERE